VLPQLICVPEPIAAAEGGIGGARLLGRERPLKPVSRASHSAQLLGDLVLAVCAGNSFTGGNATAHEGEGSHRDCSQRGCGRERLRQFIKNHNVNLLTVRDPSGKTNAAYGTFKFPESYIIDRKGIIQHKFLGAVDWTDQQVIDLLNGLSNQNGAEQVRKAEADNSMSPKIVEQPEFMVAGIAVRTSNAKEMTADGVIGKQWARLLQEGTLAKIPNKADASIVAVYTDYASDKDGEYTYLLGARVTSDKGLPAGVIAKKIPAGKFAVFTTEKGPASKVVPETWVRINSLPKSAVGGDRVYRADYEVYDERARDPQNLQADIYVGIR